MSAPTMELDDLKLAWQDLDRKLERQYRLDLTRYREDSGRRMKSGLRPLVWGQIGQIALGAAMALLGGDFWADHRATPHLLLNGLVLHAYGIAAIVSAAAVLTMAARIDYAEPVVTIQKRLVILRRTYVRTGLAVGLAWWLMWIPLLAVLLMRGFGADLYLQAPALFWFGGAVGVAGLLATFWLFRWSRHPRRPRFARRLDDSLSGASLRRAQATLDEIAHLERE